MCVCVCVCVCVGGVEGRGLTGGGGGKAVATPVSRRDRKLCQLRSAALTNLAIVARPLVKPTQAISYISHNDVVSHLSTPD